MTILRTILRWIAPLLILGVGVGIFMTLGKQPPPPRKEAAAVGAVSVRTAVVLSEEEGIDVAADGVVVPIREVSLAAAVGGRVIMKWNGWNVSWPRRAWPSRRSTRRLPRMPSHSPWPSVRSNLPGAKWAVSTR
jgi:hypothetical protein